MSKSFSPHTYTNIVLSSCFREPKSGNDFSSVDLEGFNGIGPEELEELYEAVAKYKADVQFRQQNEYCALFLFIGTTILIPYDPDNQPLSVQDYQKLKMFDILIQSKLSNATYNLFST